MNATDNLLANVDWRHVEEDMHARGYAHVPRVLTSRMCRDLIASYDEATLYRKTIVMERYRFGLGEYKYFAYPLPAILQTIRETVYPQLVPIADRWMEWLGMDQRFPATLAELQARCHREGQ